MLRTKEIQDQIYREAEAARLQDRIQNKRSIQGQIDEHKLLEAEAQQEYLKEKEQVDNII